MRALRRICTTGAIVGAFVLAGTHQANAAEYGTAYAANSCGAAFFESTGDIFTFIDSCADGRGVRLYWKYDGDASWKHHDYSGGRTPPGSTLPRWNTDLREDRYFSYKVGLVDNGSPVANSIGRTQQGWTG